MNNLDRYFSQLQLPQTDSHKGQNGKVLIVGGSELFHAASKWSLDVASRLVDMVFYSSVPSNNKLIQEAKKEFWNGIVVDRDSVADYAEEADCILIGPGMIRSQETTHITHQLFQQFPNKKWVVDAGALQMADPNLFPHRSIVTPHYKELELLAGKPGGSEPELLARGLTLLIKGQVDVVMQGKEKVEISGGNAGMTKGGTGDVLAGLVAGLYATNEALPAAVVASYVNKKAGEELAKVQGTFFNASDLAKQVPRVLYSQLLQEYS